jgi:hypothetical protein
MNPSAQSEPQSAETPIPPTAPCTVVWCDGKPYVLEGASARPRWVGTDRRGRPQTLTRADLQRRGWSYRRAG